MMMMRGFSKSVAAKRAFSTARMTVAQNVLMLEEMSSAASPAALAEASAKKHNIDVQNLPAAISSWSAYLGSASASESAFQADANAWQNKHYVSMVAEDFQREETWPFLVTALLAIYLIGIKLPGLAGDARAGSKYISRMEGREGKLAGDHH